MEKIEEKQVVSTVTTHIYICDHCGKEIGRADELDDGYAPSHGHIDSRIMFGKYNMRIEGHLCDECYSAIANEFYNKAKCFFKSKHLEVGRCLLSKLGVE